MAFSRSSPACQAVALRRLVTRPSSLSRSGFTLIELLVVISIIAILVGLAFPVIGGVLDRAKKVQAKNDLMQIVTAVNAFYTEYGQYPLPANPTSEKDTYSGNNKPLFDALRGRDPVKNPRTIAFLTLPAAKDVSHPKAGIGNNDQFYDPWGTPYTVGIDFDYDNHIQNPYQNAGPTTLDAGVIAYSFGKNGIQDTDAKVRAFDDVLSWQ